MSVDLKIMALEDRINHQLDELAVAIDDRLDRLEEKARRAECLLIEVTNVVVDHYKATHVLDKDGRAEGDESEDGILNVIQGIAAEIEDAMGADLEALRRSWADGTYDDGGPA